MEPIKITDKLTLRQEALRMAVELSKSHAKCVGDTIHNAELFANYLQGKSVLPEYVDTSKMFTDVMEKMNERWNQPNPWISADSEMKPAKGVKVFVRTKSESFYSGEYDDGWYVAHKPIGDEIIAWMPIPPFAQPTL